MKKFLQKIFMPYSTAQGAFCSLVLLILGGWLLATLFILSHGIYALGKFFFAIFHRTWPQLALADYPWQLCLILLFLLLVIYFLFQQGRFWKNFRRGTCGRNSGKWFAGAVALWCGTLFCTIYSIVLLFTNYFYDGCCMEYLLADAWNLPYWLTAALLLLTGSVLASGKFFALAENLSYRKIFTLPVKAVAGISLITYISLVLAAVFSSSQCQAEKAVLARHFNRPLTAETLQKLILNNPDEKFWQEVSSLFSKSFPQELRCSSAEFTPEQLEAWKKEFSTFQEFARIDRMLESPLPAMPQKIEKYHLLHIMFANLAVTYGMVHVQEWNIRFALENHDRAAVMAAIKRLDNLSDYVAQHIFPDAFSVMSIERKKINAVTRVLAAQILTADDLRYIKQRSCAFRQNLSALERNSVWGEALAGVDFLESYVNMKADFKQQKRFTPLKRFFWLLPQGWLIYERNRLIFLRLYRNAEKFSDIQIPPPGSVFSVFSNFFPAGNTAARDFAKTRLEHEAIEFFIDQELCRIQTGRLPENLPLPVDHISGKPMEYIHGNITIKKQLFNGENKTITISGRQLISNIPNVYKLTITVPDPRPVAEHKR